MAKTAHRSKSAHSTGLARWVLKVERGPGKGTLYDLSNGQNIIGRRMDVSIPILDLSVSREHACLELSSGQPVLKDLSSKNGTLVNNQSVQNAVPMNSGDRIQLGDTVFRILAKSQAEHDVEVRSGEETISLNLATPDDLHVQKSRTFADATGGGIRSLTLSQMMSSDDVQFRRMKWMTYGFAIFVVLSAILLTFFYRS